MADSHPHCIHGIDTRFCSICNRQKHDGKRSVRRLAVGCLGLSEIIPLSMGARLGSRCAEASWVVSAATGMPTDYAKDEMHPALFRERELISSGAELMRRLKEWRAVRATE